METIDDDVLGEDDVMTFTIHDHTTGETIEHVDEYDLEDAMRALFDVDDQPWIPPTIGALVRKARMREYVGDECDALNVGLREE